MAHAFCPQRTWKSMAHPHVLEEIRSNGSFHRLVTEACTGRLRRQCVFHMHWSIFRPMRIAYRQTGNDSSHLNIQAGDRGRVGGTAQNSLLACLSLVERGVQGKYPLYSHLPVFMGDIPKRWDYTLQLFLDVNEAFFAGGDNT